MLMQTKPIVNLEREINLDPMKREPLKWDLKMRFAIERAQYQPKMTALSSRVDEYRMLWRE